MKKLATILTMSCICLFGSLQTHASTTHKVKTGETYYKIASTYGVSVHELMNSNGASSTLIYPGQSIKIPSTITSSEKDLVARLVEAEAKGESYAGKVAVATVILNRVDSSLFPNTITGVIYQNGQFTPVQNGKINESASADSKRAVSEALAYRGQGSGSLYFYNPDKTTNRWLRSKQVTVVIGNHVFAK
ncbi:peptidoglycan-binding protein [Bacillus coahuilensis m2-6]|uniref:cell wall hydrolase n=1 Tax=Bacillus coahuilensis TaxID=408580 RepID=UPI0007500AA7|nr:cell wall hydrolase [Bacillus coahuilensis]KUP06931.1 peptidoglycan-binding protein [Bacillus coahuilensis m2-6]